MRGLLWYYRLIANGNPIAAALASSSYNHNTLKTLMTSALPSPDYKFFTATMKCICNDSFTEGGQQIVVVR